MTLQLGDVAPDFEAENGFIAGSVHTTASK